MIDETVDRIERMETHSSSIVALESLHSMAELLDREFESVDTFVRAVEHNSRALRRANPSHPTLFSAQRQLRAAVTSATVEDVDAAKAVLRDAIEDGVTAIQTSKRGAAAEAMALLEDGSRVLTHDYSTTVLEAIERAAGNGLELAVVVSEARPRCLGRKTARTLADMDHVSVTLGVDSAAGSLVADCDLVLTGMTCIVDDMLYNRVGTLPIVTAADHHGVPAYSVGSSGKIVSDRFVFENDERSPIEVIREPIDGVTVRNPAYDATPVELLAGIVTESGVEGSG